MMRLLGLPSRLTYSMATGRWWSMAWAWIRASPVRRFVARLRTSVKDVDRAPAALSGFASSVSAVRAGSGPGGVARRLVAVVALVRLAFGGMGGPLRCAVGRSRM